MRAPSPGFRACCGRCRVGGLHVHACEVPVVAAGVGEPFVAGVLAPGGLWAGLAAGLDGGNAVEEGVLSSVWLGPEVVRVCIRDRRVG